MELKPTPNLPHLIPVETGKKHCFLLLSPLLLAEEQRQRKANKLGDGRLRYSSFFVKLLLDSRGSPAYQPHLPCHLQSAQTYWCMVSPSIFLTCSATLPATQSELWTVLPHTGTHSSSLLGNRPWVTFRRFPTWVFLWNSTPFSS